MQEPMHISLRLHPGLPKTTQKHTIENVSIAIFYGPQGTN
jgi:hypothetical protein